MELQSVSTIRILLDQFNVKFENVSNGVEIEYQLVLNMFYLFRLICRIKSRVNGISNVKYFQPI